MNRAGNQPDNQPPTIAQPPASQPATTNEEGKKAKTEINCESNKASLALKNLRPELTELMADAHKILGADEMKRCHARWLDRADSDPKKLRRVLDDTARAAKDNAIKTTPAQYAENRWKEFKSRKQARAGDKASDE